MAAKKGRMRKRSREFAVAEGLECRRLLTAGTGSISGVVYEDRDGNGKHDMYEPLLAVRTVYVDANNNQALDPGEVSAVTDINGAYTLSGVAAGTAVVRQVVPSGWVGTGLVSRVVYVAAGGTYGGNDLGQFKLMTVNGLVFIDTNADGRRDINEQALSGVKIYADLNSNNQYDAGEPFTITDANGVYNLENLGPGANRLRIVTGSGWFPKDDGNDLAPSSGVTWHINWPLTTQSYISGQVDYANATGGDSFNGIGQVTVYADLNNNGVLDSGEPQSSTNGYGRFSLVVPTGPVTVRVVVPTLYTPDSPRSYATTVGTFTRNYIGPFVLNTALPRGGIYGDAFQDANANGVFDLTELPAVGRTIYIDANNNGLLDPGEATAITSTSGAWGFKELPFGTYVIRQILPAGWQQTTPDGYQTITIKNLNPNSAVYGGYPFGSVQSSPFLPTASAGGPYRVNEGSRITLSGSGSATGAGIVDYQWDLNYDGSTFTVDAMGQNATFSAAALIGPSTRTIALRVVDSSNNISAVSTATVSVDGVAPVPRITGPARIAEGSQYTVALSAINAGIETTDHWTIDWGDGAVDTLPGSATSASHPYKDGPAGYVIHATAVDIGGAAGTTSLLLDSAFGVAGVTTDPQFGNAFAMQPDGKYLLAGSDNVADSSFTVRRYNADGSPDLSFGSQGIAAINLTSGTDYANALAVGADGKIVAAGACNTFGTAEVGVVRLNSDGTPDLTFNGSGQVVTTLAGGSSYADAVAIAKDGGVIAAGTSSQGLTVLRYTKTGALDATFNGTGVATTTWPSSLGFSGGTARAVAIQSDGSIVAAGSDVPGNMVARMVVVRFTPAGALDPGFGNGGRVVLDPPGGWDEADALVLQSDGKIVTAGSTGATTEPVSLPDMEFMLVRLNIDGSLDPTFGSGGVVESDFGYNDERAFALALDAQNRIIAAGSGGAISAVKALIARYLPNGSIDPSFGNHGNMQFGFGTRLDLFHGIAVQPDGSIAAGAQALYGSTILHLLPGVTVTNVPPTAVFSGSTTTLGATGTVGFTQPIDPSSTDVAAGFKYSFDFNNDGTFDVVDGTSASVTVPAQYLSSTGPHTIKGRIKDKDGGFNDYTANVQVNPALLGSIAGNVFNDANADGAKQTGETPLGGVKLFIDANKNGKVDVGEKTATTDANGSYSFAGLAPGSYRVREVVPAGYRITSPPSGYYDVTVVGGQNATGKTFGNTKLALLSGNVFNDFNGNGVRDSGETALAGIKVYIDANKNGVFDVGEKSTTTNAAGNWSFALPAGTYRVREVPPAGYRISSPATGYFDITVLSGQTITGKTFADTNKVLISGVLFNDANGNGSKDTGETSLGGWTIYVDLNKDGKFDAGDVNTTTDVSGNWSFHGLSAGTYVIRVVTKIGWSQTRPAANGGQSVTLLSGQTKTGLLFSEKQSA
jgi:uncharacterized delta-60 repeat protein